MSRDIQTELERKWLKGSILGCRVLILGRVRTVVAKYSDIPVAVAVDKPVDGFVSWNLDTMEPYRATK